MLAAVAGHQTFRALDLASSSFCSSFTSAFFKVSTWAFWSFTCSWKLCVSRSAVW